MTSLPVVQLVDGPVSEAPADLVVVPTWDGDDLGDLSTVRDLCGPDLAAARARGEFRGKPYELYSSAAGVPQRVLFIGVGSIADANGERARRAGTAAALSARQRGFGRLACCVRGPLATPAMVQAVVEGLVLAGFDGDFMKTSPRESAALEAVFVACAQVSDDLRAAVVRGTILGEATNAARRLVAEPGNVLTPRELAARAGALLEGTGVALEVLDEHRIAELGMGLIEGVTRGSSEPPRVLVMRYEPEGAPTGPVLGLVGKGITFDTGGISIKPAEGMERMKYDMAGGAAVVGAMHAIGRFQPRVRVIGVVPICENMPGGRAFKPGDVLRSAAGRTVEVTNTDAEGRLVLGDALWYARELGATHLVDLATLTGACAVALGRLYAGIFGTDEGWTAVVRTTAEAAGDRVWPLPLHEEFLEQLRSDIADIVNAGSRYGGASTAAMFLKEFVGDCPWVHLDIAGTAWIDEAKPYLPKGPTGVGVRTLAALPFITADWQG